MVNNTKAVSTESQESKKKTFIFFITKNQVMNQTQLTEIKVLHFEENNFMTKSWLCCKKNQSLKIQLNVKLENQSLT